MNYKQSIRDKRDLKEPIPHYMFPEEKAFLDEKYIINLVKQKQKQQKIVDDNDQTQKNQFNS